MTSTDASPSIPDPTSDDAKESLASVANRMAGRAAPGVQPAQPWLLDAALSHAWERDGFFVLRGLLDTSTADAVNDEAIRLVRVLAETGDEVGGYRSGDGLFSVPEPNLALEGAAATEAEDHVSKLFNLHRRPVFEDLARGPELVEVLVGLLGPEVDCFNSQFIFKNPGAWGQPWHQDSLYFSFDRFPQAGIWIATSRATEENGCLFVAPGSHAEPLHEHVPDRRPAANLGYLEIVDHDFSAAVPVEMEPGDVLVFHSFLMHRSVDNRSDQRRTALVLHYTATGTQPLGDVSATVDFMTVTSGRDGQTR